MPLTTIARLTWSQEGFVRNVVFKNVLLREWRKSGFSRIMRELWRENHGRIKSTGPISTNILCNVFFSFPEILMIPVRQHPMETSGNQMSESTWIYQAGIKRKRRRFIINMMIFSRGRRRLAKKSKRTISNMTISGEVKIIWIFNESIISFSFSIGEIVNMAISAEYEAFRGPPLSSLNDREQSKLQELFIASRALAETIGEEEDLSFNKFNAEPSLIRWLHLSYQNSFLCNLCVVYFVKNPFCSVINLTELAIKRIIKMAKQIYSFSQLCQEDQVALLKGGCIELMVLRSVMNYDTEKQTWQVIGTEIGEMTWNISIQIPAYSCLRVVSSDVLKEASQLGVNLYEEHLK